VNETGYLALTKKCLLSFDVREEGLEKLFKFKDATSKLIPFPFYDSVDLPYLVGDHSKIYDTRVREEVGELEGSDSFSLCMLGFLRQSTILVASTEDRGLMLLNLEIVTSQ